MTAIVTGNGLGLTNTSLGLGTQGQLGAAATGQTGERIYVNAATGNLVVQDQDEWLVGMGPDVGITRTYNGLSEASDSGNANVNHNWRLGYSRSVKLVSGTVNTAGSTVLRVAEDGTEVTYGWNGTQYVPQTGKGVSGVQDTLSFNTSTQKWTWIDGASQTQETYNAAGQLINVTDTNGHKLTLTYKATNGLIDTITDDNGETVTVEYDGSNNLKDILTQYKDANQQTQTLKRVSYAYAVVNGAYQVTVTVSLGTGGSTAGGTVVPYTGGGSTYTTTYTYNDAAGTRITSIKQLDNSLLTINYVSATDNRVQSYTVKQDASTSATTTFDYTSGGPGVTKVQDANGKTTTLTYDTTTLQLKSIAQPAVNGASPTTYFTYDTATGNVSTVKDPRGNTTTYRYDANGNCTYEQSAAGNVVERTFSASNLLLTETTYTTVDPDGPSGSQLPTGAQVTHYIYSTDGKGNLRFVVSPEGRVTEYQYNTAGLRAAAIQYAGGLFSVPASSTWGQDFAASTNDLNTWLGTQLKSRSQRTDYIYNGRGELQTQTTYATVDANANGVLDGTQAVTNYIYDQAGNLLQRIDPRHGTGSRYLTTYAYDGLNRLTWQTDGEGNTTQTSFSRVGPNLYLVILTVADGSTETRYYDNGGRLIDREWATATGGNAGATLYAYDMLNRLVKTADATGVASYVIYDADGRKVADISGNNELTQYDYNADGQLVSTTAYANPVTNTAALANLDTVTLAGVKPVPDATNDRVTRNIYDAAGRLAMTIDPAGAAVEYRYDGAGRLTDTLAYGAVLTTAQLANLTNAIAEPSVATGVISVTTATGLVTMSLSQTDTTNRHPRQFYSADGLLLGSLDATGAVTANTYDAAGRLTQTIRYASLVPSVALRNTGKWADVIPTTDPYGENQTTQYLYNARGQLIGIADAEGYYTEYRYDAAGNKSTEIRYWNRLFGTFDGVTPPVITSTAPAGGASYIPSHAEDRSAQYLYDANNRLLQTTSLPDGAVTTYTYDSVGNLIKTQQAVGMPEQRTTQRQYDSLGRVTAELGGEGNVALATLLARTTPAVTQSEIDAIWRDYGTSYQYDQAGRRVASITPSGSGGAGNKTLYYYDNDSRLTHSINALGEVTRYTYDAFGDQLTATRYGTRIGSTALASLTGGLNSASDLQAALASLSNATLDSVTRAIYDKRGQAVTLTDALGHSINRIYTAFGQIKTQTDQVSATTTLTTGYTYNQTGLLATQKQTGAGVSRFVAYRSYDAFGRLATSIDGNVNGSSYEYDKLGRLVSTTDPSGAYDVTSYDAFGRVLHYMDKLGASTWISTNTYDSANRTVKIKTPQGITSTTVTNHLGQTVSVTDMLGNVTAYAYDHDGRLIDTTVTAAGGSVLTHSHVTYDKAGRVYESTDGNNVVTRTTYDAANRVLTQVVDPNGLKLTTQYLYDAKGQAAWTCDANGVWTQTEYDLKGQVTAITVDPAQVPDTANPGQTKANPSGAAALKLRTEFSFDTQGNTLTVARGVDASQTGVARYAKAQVTRYVYDAAGRRTQEITDPKHSPLWTTGADDNPNGLNLTTTYVYDANDNVVAKTVDANGLAYTTHYVYDSTNRVIYTVDPSGAVVRNEYDSNGRMTRTTAYATRITATGLSGLPNIELAGSDIEGALMAADANYATNLANQIGINTYDKDGRLIYTVDALNHVTARVYDGANNVVKLTRYATPSATPTVNASLNINAPDAISFTVTPPAVDAANDQVEQYVYDGANRLTFKIDALGYVTQNTYDANSNVTQVTRYFSPNVVQSANRASPLPANEVAITGTGLIAGNITVVKTPASDQTTTTYYDNANRAVFSVDAENYLTQRDYDNDGHLIALTRYDAKLNYTGTLSTTVQPQVLPANATSFPSTPYLLKRTQDVLTTYAYDSAGRLTDTTEASGATEVTTTHTVYDTAGRITDVTVGYNKPTEASTTHYKYDAAGRVVDEIRGYQAGVITAPDQADTRYVLDGVGNRLSIIDPRGTELAESNTAWAQSTRVSLGYAQQVSGLSAADQTNLKALYTTTQQFDGLGRVTQVTDATSAHGVTKTSYDAFGNAVKVTDPNGSSGYFFFSAANQAIWHVDPMGYATKTDYNALGQVTTITKYANAVQNLGTLTTVAAPTVYSSTDLATYQSQHSGALPSTPYILASTSDGTTSLLHDKLGNQTQITDAAGFSESMTYDAFGNKLTYTAKSNTALTTDVGGTYTYAYDRLGNLVQEKLPDQVNQLNLTTGAIVYGADNKPAKVDVINIYQYDSRGNRIKTIEASGLFEQRTTQYRYDALNRQISRAGQAVSTYVVGVGVTTNVTPTETRQYDARGNLIEVKAADGGRTLTYWDALNRKTAEVSAVGTLVSYSYNQSGDLVSQTMYGDLISLPPTAGGSAPAPTNVANARVIRYTYDANHRLVSTTTPNILVGSISANTGNYEVRTQDLVKTKSYDANGNVVCDTDARGNSTWHLYDKLGNEVFTVDANRFVTYRVFDGSGNAIQETRYAIALPSSVELKASLSASALDTIVKQQPSSDDRTTTYVRDQLGRIKEQRVFNVQAKQLNTNGGLQDAALVNGQSVALTQFTYNGLGLVTQKTEATGEVLTWVYDKQGRLTETLDAQFADYTSTSTQANLVQHIVDTEYNGLSLTERTLERGANNSSETDDRITLYTYGTNGWQTAQTDATGATTTFRYDASGRVTAKSLTRLDAANANASTDVTTYFYDLIGRETQHATYNLAGSSAFLQSGTTYQALQTQDVRYNAYGEIVAKGTDGGWQESVTYDNAGHVIKSNVGTGGVTKAYVFDANGNTTLTIESTGVDLGSVSYGDILLRTDTYQTVAVYDACNHLTDTYQAKLNGALGTVGYAAWQVASGVNGNSSFVSATASVVAPSSDGLISKGTFTSDMFAFVGPGTTTVNPFSAVTGQRASKAGVDVSVPFTLTLPDTSGLGTGDIQIEYSIQDTPKAFGTSTWWNSPTVTPWMESAYVCTDADYVGNVVGFAPYGNAYGPNLNLYMPDAASPIRLPYTTTSMALHVGGELAIGDSLSGSFHVYKIVNQQKIDIFGSIPFIVSNTNGVSQVAMTLPTSKPVLKIQNQPATTKRLVMSYRAAGSTSAWKTITLQPGTTDANSRPVFGLMDQSSTPLPAGNYEMQYVALDALGNVLNSEQGTMLVTAAAITVTQSARTIGGAGRVFADTDGKLNVTEQGGNARTAVLKVTPSAGGTSQTLTALSGATIGGTVVPGWFQFDTGSLTLGADVPYVYTLTSYGADGTTITNQVSGTLKKGASGAMSLGDLTLVASTTEAGAVTRNSVFGSDGISISATSTPYTSYYADSQNQVFPYATVSGTATLSIPDTSSMGTGNIKVVCVTVGSPKQVGRVALNADFKESVFSSPDDGITDPNAIPYTQRSVLLDVGGLVLQGSKLQGQIHVYKVVGNQDVELTNPISPIGFTVDDTGGVGQAQFITTPKADLTIQNQPASAKSVVMAYRLQTATGPWTVATLQQLDIGTNDSTSFALTHPWGGASLPLGNYDIQYVALNATGDVLNSEQGTMQVTALKGATINTLSARTIGGAGRAFMSTDGKLNFTEQGSNAATAVLAVTPAAGGTTVTLPAATAASINGSVIPGWFQFDLSSLNLANTNYTYTVICKGADGSTITNQINGNIAKSATGFSFNGAPVLVSSTSFAGTVATGSFASSVATMSALGAVMTTTFQAHPNSGMYSYKAAVEVAAPFTLFLPDTSGLGSADIQLECSLQGSPAQIGTGSYFSNWKENVFVVPGSYYEPGIQGAPGDASSASYAATSATFYLGGQMLPGGALSGTLRVYKVVNGQKVDIYNSIPFTVSNTNGVSQVTMTPPASKPVLKIQNQPASTTRLVMSYRTAGSTNAWKMLTLQPGATDANGRPVFGLMDSINSPLPSGNYEIQYMALDMLGNILNSEQGTMQVTASAITVTQAARTVGGAGHAFVDTDGKLNITEQGSNAVNASILLLSADGTTQVVNAPITVSAAKLGGGTTTGWFQFDLASLGLTSGTRTYVVEVHRPDGSVSNLLSGTVTFGSSPTSSVAQRIAGGQYVNFQNLPVTAVRGRVTYRSKAPGSTSTTTSLSTSSPGTFTWLPQVQISSAQDYDVSYEVFDASNRLVGSGAATITLGNSSAALQSASNALNNNQWVFNPVQANAAQATVYYRVAGSGAAYTPSASLSIDATGRIVFDASALVPSSGSTLYDYYYVLRDSTGTPITTTGGQALQISGQVRMVSVAAQPAALQLAILGVNNTAESTHKSQTYNAFGEIVTQTDTLGHTTTFTYNTQGKLLSQQDPLTDVVDEHGAVTRANPTTYYSYDLQGRLIGTKDANGWLTTQAWVDESIDGQSQVSVEYHPDGGKQYSRYDRFGDQIQSINENWDGQDSTKAGYTTTTTYDADHRVTKVGRPLRDTYSVSGYDRYEYDSAGNRVRHYATSDGTSEFPADYSYFDALGRVVKTVSAQSRTTTIVYEDGVAVTGLNGQTIIGERKTTIDANGNKLIDEQDYTGRVTRHTDLGGHVYQYNYNGAGWLTSQTSSVGQNIGYQYYADGRLKQLSDYVLSTYGQYEYDSEGNKTYEAYATKYDFNIFQRANITYDELNRIKTITDPKYTLSYSYDAVGNRRHLVGTTVSGITPVQDYWYAYDAMNRFVVTMGTLTGTAGAADTKITAGPNGGAGIAIRYDKTGQRVGADIVRDGHSEQYFYSKDGFLETAKATNVGKYVAPTAVAPNGTNPTAADYWTVAVRNNDLMGRVGTYTEYAAGGVYVSSTHQYWYDNDSKTTKDVLSQQDGVNVTTITTRYDMQSDGTVWHLQSDSSSTAQGSTTTTQHTYYGYELWDSAQQSTITSQAYNKDAPGWLPGASHLTYDINGHVSQAIDSVAGRTLTYTNNAQGLVLFRNETKPDPANPGATTTKTQTFYYVDGQRVGETGDDAGTIDYTQALATATVHVPAPKKKKSFLSGALGFADPILGMATTSKFYMGGPTIVEINRPGTSVRPVTSNFDANYQAINASYPAFTSNGYTVKTGDNLESIARAVWGDSSMWYLIADANGMMSSSTTLTAGQTLVIPNKVANIHNNSGTHSVYDPNEALGDVSPTLPSPPPPAPQQKKGCGAVGAILIVVIVIVVTVVTEGALTDAAIQAGMGTSTAGAGAGAAGAGAGAGAAGVGAGTATGVTLSAATQVGIGALSAAAGAFAGQTAAIAMGMQTGGYNWNAIGTAAIGGAIGSGLNSWSAFKGLNAIEQAAATNALSQGASMALGLQKKFDWRGVAAAGLSAGINKLVVGNASATSLEGFGKRAFAGLTNGGLNAAIYNKTPDWSSIAANSFGSALGDSIVTTIQQNDMVNALVGPGQEAFNEAYKSGASFEEALKIGLDTHQGYIEYTKQRIANVMDQESRRTRHLLLEDDLGFSTQYVGTATTHTGIVDVIGQQYASGTYLDEISAFSQLPDQIKLTDGLTSGVRNFNPLVNSDAREVVKLYEESLHVLNGKSVAENINFQLDQIDSANFGDTALLGLAMHGLLDSVFHARYDGNDIDALLASKTYSAPIGHGLHGSDPDHITDFKRNTAAQLTSKAFADITGASQEEYEDATLQGLKNVAKLDINRLSADGEARERAFNEEYARSTRNARFSPGEVNLSSPTDVLIPGGVTFDADVVNTKKFLDSTPLRRFNSGDYAANFLARGLDAARRIANDFNSQFNMNYKSVTDTNYGQDMGGSYSNKLKPVTRSYDI